MDPPLGMKRENGPFLELLQDPQCDRRVTAGESVASGVDWVIGVFWNGGRPPGVPLEVQVVTTSS